ncbi:MAG: hypothetical protein COB84_01445 [Rhodobacteraceae bacterium]|nr:MAG: hypothetical protein COB84_01445 [Paracoccaceae bacterium]
MEKWWDDYNYHRPHSSIGNLTPSKFVEKIRPQVNLQTAKCGAVAVCT